MATEIALSPELGLSPAEFVAAWNATPGCRATAETSLARPKSGSYDPLAAAVAVLGGLAMGVAGNALYDLVKAAVRRALGDRGPQQRIEVRELLQSDGSRVLIVTVENR